MTPSLVQVLSSYPAAECLKHHPFFTALDEHPGLTREHVDLLLGQWLRPLHYFPTFLANLITEVPKLAHKTHISQILYQELGEGDPVKAHEELFLVTMEEVGFNRDSLYCAGNLPATHALMKEYKGIGTRLPFGEKRLYPRLGHLYATEAVDLCMVSAIGRAVTRVTGATALPWVTVHQRQEPDHIKSATSSLPTDFSPDNERLIIMAAEHMWGLWYNFFEDIHRATLGTIKAS